MSDIAELYESGKVIGWPGQEFAKHEFNLVRDEFYTLPQELVVGAAAKKRFLYQTVRQALGGDIPNIAQEIGDCFQSGTAITMSDNTFKNIEDIVQGESVVTHLGNVKKVLNTIKKKFSGNLVKLTATAYDQTIAATEDHLFLRYDNDATTDSSWKSIGSLQPKVDCVKAGGLIRFVKETQIIPVVDMDVFCLEVEDDHSFLANGYAVHNCVSWGARNATLRVACVQKAIANDKIIIKDIFTPYYYGTGRVYVGNNRINGDGSTGSWMAQAVMRYGTLFVDDEGVPRYSGSTAKQWGSSRQTLDKYQPIAIDNPVKSAARIRSWSELVGAIVNGYVCTIASSVGFRMKPDRDGFHERTNERWDHQMCIADIDDEFEEPYGLLTNSWGDVHGRLISFYDSNDKIPIGTLRPRKKWIELMIQTGECYAYSGFVGFPDKTDAIDKSKFKLI